MSSTFSVNLCEKCGEKLTWIRKEPGSPLVLSQLRNNYLLTDINGSEATQTILSTLQEISPELDRYEREIGRISCILAELKHEYAQLKRFSDEYRALLAPVRRLPGELLAEVLGFHCSALSNRINEDSPSPAIEFSQTCSFWRAVALAQSRFWSKLCVDLSVASRNYEWISELLRRSGNAPLTLAVHNSVNKAEDYFPRRAEQAALENAFVQLLLHYSDRWAEVRIRDSIEFHLLQGKDYPMLEYLEIQAQDRRTLDLGRPWHFLRSSSGIAMPNLHTLIMPDYSSLNLDPSFQVLSSLPSLTNFVINGTDVTSALWLMENSPRRLSHISFIIERDMSLGSSHAIHTCRTDITSLSVCFRLTDGTRTWFGSYSRNTSFLFGRLSAPRLTSLEVSIEIPPDWDWKTKWDRVGLWPQLNFLKMLSYCSPTLESLSLAGIPLWMEDIPELFKTVPALTRLSITQWPIANAPHTLIFFLSLTSRESLLLPQLIELNLGVGDRESVEGEMIARLIRARSRSSEAVLNGDVVCLEKLTVRVGEKLGDTPVSWSTRDLDGTVLEIGYEGKPGV